MNGLFPAPESGSGELQRKGPRRPPWPTWQLRPPWKTTQANEIDLILCAVAGYGLSGHSLYTAGSAGLERIPAFDLSAGCSVCTPWCGGKHAAGRPTKRPWLWGGPLSESQTEIVPVYSLAMGPVLPFRSSAPGFRCPGHRIGAGSGRTCPTTACGKLSAAGLSGQRRETALY